MGGADTGTLALGTVEAGMAEASCAAVDSCMGAASHMAVVAWCMGAAVDMLAGIISQPIADRVLAMLAATAKKTFAFVEFLVKACSDLAD